MKGSEVDNRKKVEITNSHLLQESRRLSTSEEENVNRPELPPPPDGGYGWVIVVASFFCNMVVDGITYTFGVFLTQFVNYYGEGKGKVAWVGSILTGMCFIAGPVVGGLSNKYGCRTVSICGSILGCAAFIISTFSPNVEVLMLTYGVGGGIAFGMIYLPAVVCVGYYFETKRSLATGIAVCGSGFGAFAFAPLAQFLLANFTWQQANLCLSGIILACSIFGALMRPLKFEEPPKHKPLLQRMAEDKKNQMELGSVQGSFFMVQLADGTFQKLMKVPPINIDPGVHSALYLDQLTPATPVSTAPPQSLPTITESKTPHSSASVIDGNENDRKFSFEAKDTEKFKTLHGFPNGSDKNLLDVSTQPEFVRPGRTDVENGSAPLLNKIGRKRSIEYDGDVFGTSGISITMSKDHLRPMLKKDVFYSGSVQNLKEYQSQGSLSAYRQSTLSIPQQRRSENRTPSEDCCPCLPGPLVLVLSSMVDVSLIKDPVFLFIGFSNLCGFAALYVPFVYLVDHATKDGISAQDASLLISVIGITNTVGRIICGWIADFPFVNSLLLNNCSLVLAAAAVMSISFCHSYFSYLVMAVTFGIAIAIFISLTSIILVDLLGLDKLTNAFGLLMLFRGVAALIGSPIAGMVYDATGTYEYPFYMGAFMFLISAILSFAVPFLKGCVKPEQKKKVEITNSHLPQESRRLSTSEEENVNRPELPPPPDGGYGWVIVVASFFCNMVVDGITYTFGVFLTQFVNYYGEGKGKVAWVGSILTGMCFIAGPVVGGLSNKYGCRTVSICGSILGCAAFIISTFSPNVEVLMLTYGVGGGIAFGMIYLPAVVCVGYYFETKRSLATGIAVCGSGFGAFAFAPLAQFLLANFTWQQANLCLSGIILACSIFGALMRPLRFEEPPKHKPLLQRMAEDKKNQMELGSIQGSFFMVQLADGTFQKLMKVPPINIDPGVHSALYLDQLTPATPVSTAPPQSLPTITESKTPHSSASVIDGNENDRKFSFEAKDTDKFKTLHGFPNGSDKNLVHVSTQPEFVRPGRTEVENGSAPLLNKIGRKRSIEYDGDVFGTSGISITMSKDHLRPMLKKDVFYSGSVQNLKEYQSQGSLSAYRQSTLSIPQQRRSENRTPSEDCCPCLPGPLVSVLSSMVDVSLIKDPVFLFIGFSNLCGFAALYVPFVYLVDHATKDGISAQDASLLISVIGITNTVGRIICGWIADFPFVNSLLLNNCSLVLAAAAVMSISFCHSYFSYLVMAVTFGIAIAIFISLTSIILVDLLGLDKLTNAFGLLMLFRGVAALIGSPIAGMVYDATGTYEYPFYMGAFMFLISAILSFAVPFLKGCGKPEQKVIILNSLERIDEGCE